MAKFTIPRLVIKPLASGGYGYYWQPSASMQKAGWKPVKLGKAATQQDEARIDAARAKNREVETWQNGGAKPREVRKILQRASMAMLVEEYRKSVDERVRQGTLPKQMRDATKGRPLSANTAKVYGTALNLIEKWALDPRTKKSLPAISIDRDRVLVLRNALMKPDKDGIVQHHRAHNTLRVLRQLFAYAKKNKLIDWENPAEDFDLETPDPRDQVWDEAGGTADMDAFAAGAVASGYPSLALAVEIAEYTAQREDDVLGLSESHWIDVSMLIEPETRRALADEQGKVMGFVLRQGKTKRPVGIPIIGRLRDKVEAAIAANRKRAVPATTIVVDDVTGKRWKVRQFIRKFSEAKAWAVSPPPEALAKGVQPRPELADKQFRDLRRTCVVRLGELGVSDEGIASITGHSPRTIKAMLDIYMPRTTNRAAITVLARHRAGTERIGNAVAVKADRKERQG